jgi:amino acid adenylation domain-containing protein
MIALNGRQVTGMTLPGLQVTVRSFDVPVAKFDLGLGVTDNRDRQGAPAGIDGGFEYATDLFDRATVEMIATKLVRLLTAAAADPQARIGDLPLLSEPERRQLLVTWNDTARPVPETTLPELFEAQVAATPQAVAVQDDDTTWTYAQLDERANQVAHWLTSRGVRAEHVVGVALPRSTDLSAALLGILKTGAAYVPLDLDHPAERLAHMKADAGVRIVLGDAEMAASRSEPTAGTWPAPSPDGVAYVIYTSGSTGRPKGVANSHRGVVNRLLWMQREFAIDESDVVVQKTPFGFDVSVWELFWPLLTGARLRFARPGGHRDPEYLRDLFVTDGVTTAHFVPSMLAAFAAAGGPRATTSLRRIICSGEALPPQLAADVIAAAPWCALYNLYGPTEAAIDVTWWRCDGGAVVPIGRPIDNIRMYVLDGGLRPVPAGVPGELFIAGVGVARGY